MVRTFADHIRDDMGRITNMSSGTIAPRQGQDGPDPLGPRSEGEDTRTHASYRPGEASLLISLLPAPRGAEPYQVNPPCLDLS